MSLGHDGVIRGGWLLRMVVVTLIGAQQGCAAPQYATSAETWTPCRGPDEVSELHVWILQQDAAATDRDLVAHWDTSGFVPVTASEITLVTDSAVCAAVVAAWNAAAALEPPYDPHVDSLYVIRVGPRYDAFDPAIGVGEFVTHRVFDTSFVHLKTFVH